MRITDRSTSTPSSSYPMPTSSSHRRCRAAMRICGPLSDGRFPPSSPPQQSSWVGHGKDSAAFNPKSRDTQDMTALSGKTALVTGASRGIGRASALSLAKAGAQVLVHYGSGVKEAEAVVAQIRHAGSRADAIAADLAAPDGPHRLARQVRAIVGDRLDILVANAGISKAAAIEETTGAD